MFGRVKANWCRWSQAKVPIQGRDIRVARSVDIGNRATTGSEAPIDRILQESLRTPIGHRLPIDAIRRLSLAEKKISFEAVIGWHSHLQGVALFPGRQLPAFHAAIRAATCETQLDQLVRKFIARHQEVNYGLYLELRASAATVVA